MKLKAIMGICMALLVIGVPGAFPQDALPTVTSKETESADKPVLLGDWILFHLATEAEGLTQAERANEASKRIKKLADSTRFKVGLFSYCLRSEEE